MISTQRPQETDSGYYARVSEHIADIEAINSDLLASCKEMLAFIEMKAAHTGTMNVADILRALERVRETTSQIATAHHIGCSKTTRNVDLSRARAAIAKAENL